MITAATISQTDSHPSLVDGRAKIPLFRGLVGSRGTHAPKAGIRPGEGRDTVHIAIALIIAYLLGSVLPADLFARSRGVDIRAVGTGNPGSTNALRELGPVPGLLTGAYDASVGLVSMYLAWRLGLATGWVYTAGFAAIFGHIYPVFFRFRGGQGMAAATGMLVWGMSRAMTQGLMTTTEVAGLVVLAAVVFAATRSASAVGAFAVPVLIAQVLLARPEWEFAVFMTVLGVLIWITQVAIARSGHQFRLTEPIRQRVARMRPHTR
jgi:glycerol-3-phosphate acyltransferase PlsY